MGAAPWVRRTAAPCSRAPFTRSRPSTWLLSCAPYGGPSRRSRAKPIRPIRRVFERARIILRDEHGIAMPDNPARWDDLKAMGFEAPAQLSRGRHPSLPHVQMPRFIVALRARDAVAATALEFLILTNVRTDAVLKAQWKETRSRRGCLDSAACQPERSETPQGAVPRTSVGSGRRDRQEHGEGSRLVLRLPRPCQEQAAFQHGAPDATQANERGRTQRRGSIPSSGKPITAHGFRATFRTWAEEVATFPHAVVEQAMGHQVGGQVERAYRRTDVLEQRRKLMDAWAAYCEPKAANGKVVALHRKS